MFGGIARVPTIHKHGLDMELFRMVRCVGGGRIQIAKMELKWGLRVIRQ